MGTATSIMSKKEKVKMMAPSPSSSTWAPAPAAQCVLHNGVDHISPSDDATERSTKVTTCIRLETPIKPLDVAQIDDEDEREGKLPTKSLRQNIADEGYDSEYDEPPMCEPSSSGENYLTMVNVALTSPNKCYGSETLSVLFELIPFYRNGDSAVDNLVRTTVAAMSEEECRLVDYQGNTALVLCAQYAHEDLARLVLPKSDANAVSSAGVTALSYACGGRPLKEPLVRLLADTCNPNIPELHSGCCALHYLAPTGHCGLCELLLRKGASASVKDFYGWTPADYAQDAGHKGCADKLRAASVVQRVSATWRTESSEGGSLRRRYTEATSKIATLEAQIKALELDRDAGRHKLEAQAADLKKMQSMLKTALNEAEAQRATWRSLQAAHDAERHELTSQDSKAAESSLQDMSSQALVLAEERSAEADTRAQRLEAELDRIRSQLAHSIRRAAAATSEWSQRISEERARHEEALAKAQAIIADTQEQASTAERGRLEALADKDHALATLQLLQGRIAKCESVEKRNEQLDKDLSREVVKRKHLHNQLEDMKGRIRVYARLRPLSSEEAKRGYVEACVRRGSTSLEVTRRDRKPPHDKQTFDFDRAFSPAASQEDVFADVKSLILSCADGFNVCVFAYGQSGSGKTYTMLGSSDSVMATIDCARWDVANGSAGILPRTAVEMFRLIEERKAQCYATVSVSMFELYRDSIRDLLASKPTKLNIKLAQFSASGLVEVEPAVAKHAESLPELVKVLDTGVRSRSVAHTELNAESSRSHLIISLVITLTNCRTGATQRGKLTLVDLAGSERVRCGVRKCFGAAESDTHVQLVKSVLQSEVTQALASLCRALAVRL